MGGAKEREGQNVVCACREGGRKKETIFCKDKSAEARKMSGESKGKSRMDTKKGWGGWGGGVLTNSNPRSA